MIVNDWGITMQLTIKNSSDVVVDISAATTKTLIFVKPDGTNVVQTALFVTDGTDGKLKYTTISGDINVTGKWQLRAHVITPTYDRQTTYTNFLVDP